MDKTKFNKKAKTVELKSKSNRLFILIHGYTGSPTDFNSLIPKLKKEFNATVKVPLLPGHGTKVEDLLQYSANDYIYFLEKIIKQDLKKGKEIILGGVSFGSQLALYLASKYPIKGVFTIAAPFKFKMTPGISLFRQAGKFKKFWTKGLHPDEIIDKNKSFYYNLMPSVSIKIIDKLNKKLRKIYKKITCPCIFIYSKYEFVTDWRAAKKISKKIKSEIKETHVLNSRVHNPLHSPQKKETIDTIIKFFKKNKVFK